MQNEKFLEFLKNKNISKYRLAKRLKVTWQTVHNWTIGRNNPSAYHIREMSKILGVSAEEILNIFEGEQE